MSREITVLGAGLSGLSTSYHIGHDRCHIFEKNAYYGGHIYSEKVNGFTWDEGPHVSFTENDYVKGLFAQSVENEYLEYEVETANYYYGSWIPHPAQSNLYAVPESIRSECLNDFLESRKNFVDVKPKNYDEWLRLAFGNRFTDEFPAKYTRKYWTTDPANLTANWIGNRVFYPDIDDVKIGYKGPLDRQTHYVKKIRYPRKNGYLSFAKILVQGAQISYNKKLEKIDLHKRIIFFNDGTKYPYETLINTIPLPEFVNKSNINQEVKLAAKKLNCSSVLLINVIATHPTVRKENWIYVYDETKYSTRINCTELLSPFNGVEGKTGIQVEVYFSNYRKKTETNKLIVSKVINELIEMGLINDKKYIESFFTRWVPYANVIFDLNYKENLNTVLNELTKYGLMREDDDTEPITDWNKKFNLKQNLGNIISAGRYAQWKYYWTDDCVMRGRFIIQAIPKI